MKARPGNTAPLCGELATLLVVCPTWVGDIVMATPVLRHARRCLPNTRIVAAVRPGRERVLQGLPWVDELTLLDLAGPVGPFRAAVRARTYRPDAMLLLPNSFRSALAAVLSGASIRVGYARDGRGPLLTHGLPVDREPTPTPTIGYYARLARFAFGDEEFDTRVELAVTAEDDADADEVLRGVEPPFMVLNPGANRRDKRWPPERFAEVADRLGEKHGLRAVVSGSPNERGLAESVLAHARTPVVNLLERGVSLGALKAVLARAALLVTNDTGPRHFAAALGTPAVSLFGPTDHRWSTLDHPRERILLADPFLPEELVADRHRRQCSIDRITVGDVLEAAAALLDARDEDDP